jgi:hypothetical protein
MSQCEIMFKSKDKWEKLKHKCVMEKEANGVIRSALFEMCWFDHINQMVASMIAKVVNLAREEDMGTPTSNSHQSIEDVNHNTKLKCQKNSTTKSHIIFSHLHY